MSSALNCVTLTANAVISNFIILLSNAKFLKFQSKFQLAALRSMPCGNCLGVEVINTVGIRE